MGIQAAFNTPPWALHSLSWDIWPQYWVSLKSSRCFASELSHLVTPWWDAALGWSMLRGLESNHLSRDSSLLLWLYLDHEGGRICPLDLALGFLHSSPSFWRQKLPRSCACWEGKTYLEWFKRKIWRCHPIALVSGNREAERRIPHVLRQVSGPPGPFAHLLLAPDPHCAADSR